MRKLTKSDRLFVDKLTEAIEKVYDHTNQPVEIWRELHQNIRSIPVEKFSDKWTKEALAIIDKFVAKTIEGYLPSHIPAAQSRKMALIDGIQNYLQK